MRINLKMFFGFMLTSFYCALAIAQSNLNFEFRVLEGDIGPASITRSFAVAEDSQGHVFIVGLRGIGPVSVFNTPIQSQAFLARFSRNSNGVLVRDWIDEFGESTNNSAMSLAIDSDDNVFVAGLNSGQIVLGLTAFLRKYSAGSMQMAWEVEHDQINSESKIGVATDGVGNIYLTGTEGVGDSFPPARIGFIDCYRDSDGTEQPTLGWTEQYVTGDVFSNDVAVDFCGDIYVVGSIRPNPGGPLKPGTNVGSQVLIAKFEDAGDQANGVFEEQFGTNDDDFGNAITAGLSIREEIVVYICGTSLGGLGGDSGSLGWADAFLAKLDPNTGLIESTGSPQWCEQFGADEEDEGNDVAVDDSGNVYLAGSTLGGGSSYDAFVANYRDNSSEALFQDAELLDNVPDFTSILPRVDLGFGVCARTPGDVLLTGFSGGKFVQDDGGPILQLAWISDFSVPILGDVNCDGVFDNLDIAPFVDAIINGGYTAKADINGDGAVDPLDVDPFVQLLINTGPPACN